MPVDFKLVAGRSVARAQRRLTPKPFGIYTRGERLVLVESIVDDTISWRYEDGTADSGTLKDFRSQALDEVEIDATDVDGDYLAHAWMIAGARGTNMSARLQVLTQTLARAPEGHCAQKVQGWMGSLASGMEPQREPGDTCADCPTCRKDKT